ncbi:MAG: PKD domain-containing protein [bacterium]
MKKHLFFLLRISLLVISLLLTICTSIVHSSEVTLAWDKNSEPDLAGYKIYYKTGSSGAPYDGTGAKAGDTGLPVDSPVTVLLGNLNDPDNPTYSLTDLDNTVNYFFAVTAIDLLNNESDLSNEVSLVQSSNTSPIAKANGTYTGTEGEEIQFSSTGSGDQDGDPITYVWDFGDNQTSDHAHPSHIYAQDGSYTVSLTVSDGFLTDTEITSVTVADRNPVADFSGTPKSGYAPLTVSFTASPDSYDGINSYSWNFGDGETGTGRTVTHTFNRGRYTVSLTVTEPDGNTHTATKTNYITAANNYPIAEANGPYAGTEGEEIQFSSTGSGDQNGDPITYVWDFGDDQTSDRAYPNHSYAQEGSYEVSLTVSDGLLTATDTASVTITIDSQNIAPVAYDQDHTIDEDTVLEIMLTASDNNGDSLTYTILDQPSHGTLTGATPTMVYTPNLNFAGDDSFTFYANDSLLNSNTATVIITVNEVNDPPIADAGPNQTVKENVTVILNGSNSNDVDDSIESYRWKQKDGDSTITISNPASEYTTFTAPAAGKKGASYTFTLTVTDQRGLTSSADCTVNISNVNAPPTADAGEDFPVEEGSQDVKLDGSNSTDSDGSIATYQWEVVKGSITLSNADKAVATFDAPDDVGKNGLSLTFRLTVLDNDGLKATDMVRVNVIRDYLPPTAKASSVQTAEEGETVILSSSDSFDPDDGIASYRFIQTAGLPVILSDPISNQPSFTAPDVGAEGAYLYFDLVVTDNAGLEDSDSFRIYITDVPDEENTYTPSLSHPPSANAGPDQIVSEGYTVKLDASNSHDPDNDIAAYQWEQIAGSNVMLTDYNDDQPTFITPPVDEGGESFVFRITVTDSTGNQSTDTCIITVTWSNQVPVAYAGKDLIAGEGELVILDGINSIDPDDTIIAYLWEQIDGVQVIISDPASVRTNFTAPNVDEDGESLEFMLTVTDIHGLKSSDTIIVNICSNNPPPVANSGPDQIVDEGVTIQLDASGSTHADNGISYQWIQLSGIPVTLSDPTAATPSFVTPPVNTNEITLTFQCITEDNSGLRNTDEVTITIIDNGITGFPDEAITTTTITNEAIGINVHNGANLVLLEHVNPESITDISVEPDNYILGYIEMHLEVQTPGDSSSVTLYLSEPLEDNLRVFNHDAESGWYDFTENVTFNPERDQITITLTDGGIGDDDGVANGVIIHAPSAQTTGGSVEDPAREDVNESQRSEEETDNFIESIQKDIILPRIQTTG